jgi:hypothetical protein
MMALSWNPWSSFLMLDYFSRVYFVGVLCVVAWSFALVSKIMIGIRSMRQYVDGPTESAYLKLVRINRSLNSIHSLSVVFTSGCCANQIFGVWFTYMARVADANPFFALREAWNVAQILVCLHVTLDIIRRYATAALEKSRPLEVI